MQIAEIAKIIGGILSENDKIKSIVEDATGEDPYNIYTNDRLPRAQQIREILEKLEKDGKERWLLARVLMEPMPDETLRAIAAAYPKALQSLPPLKDQIPRVLDLLKALLSSSAMGLMNAAQPTNRNLDQLSDQTTRLYVFKSLHEVLHTLQLRLTYGVLPESSMSENFAVDLETCRKLAAQACDQATGMAKLLGPESPDAARELAWIAKLRALAAPVAPPPDVHGSVEDWLRLSVLRLIRPQLARLNGSVFQAAKTLSLTKLEELSRDTDATIEEPFSFAVRDLKPTVLARALKQKLWQDVENEFALLADSFAHSPEDAASFGAEWFSLKKRIQWLVQLDPHLKWAEDAQKYSDEISDQLAVEGSRPSLETYGKLTSLCFFAIDAMLKSDCSSLREIDGPLKPVLHPSPTASTGKSQQ